MDINFRMLPLARESRGMTQLELVTKVPNLSQGNYSRMEKGLLPIPKETLDNISSVLNFPVSFFCYSKLYTDTAEYFYRKRVTMPKKELIKLEANFDIIRIWLEQLLGDVEVPDLSLPTIEVEGNNTPEEIARKIRYAMGIPKGPIDKLVRVIEQHGILVYFLRQSPDKFDGTTIITYSGQRIIVINDNLPNYRKRFTIAHEFGHVTMHLPYSPITEPYRDVENEADRFAAEFLMPEMDIRRDLIRFKYSLLTDLKRYWKVSKAALIRRAYDLKFIDQSKYTFMMIELSRYGERRQENSDVDLDHPLILAQIIKIYGEQLNYDKQDIYNMISISPDDFDFYILGKDKETKKLRIVI
ncbi:XRE family transcriptional regulator [Pedobacter xixiisoli]|uniref:Zn-dependent peptidase ImmA, M78 family n=1 Tax=Pedobacter xixiisoli TaxID=1476464 RepID=A0A286A6X1_9SPHI|nr:XRE family transcriptional regulator [Pedobacter xixiisoli]SOD17627.1 Zn-dependent peptidase ImmA, M78 family [Pedobacter xixiisoli]